MIDSKLIFAHLINIKKNIEIHKGEIESLDQAIGDGDHIFNIMRGLEESISLEKDLENDDPGSVLKKIGLKIMTTVGGSSGALFATLLLGMAKQYNPSLSDKINLSNMMFEGVEAMKKRGKSDIGEKTMLDVLIPVSKTLKKLVVDKNTLEIAKNIREAAEKGMLSTKDIIATKGRASFLGERARGHIDPGARSSQICIEAICNMIIDN